jgi:hypothetical protein
VGLAKPSSFCDPKPTESAEPMGNHHICTAPQHTLQEHLKNISNKWNCALGSVMFCAILEKRFTGALKYIELVIF